MPYLDEDRKAAIDEGRAVPETAGDLAYVIQQQIAKYHIDNDLSFARIAEVVAALREADEDYHRRIVNPYEAQKCRSNGDVWPKPLVQAAHSGRKLY